jgi:Uma2 family endonuclease
MDSAGTLITAAELLSMPDDGYRYELVQGELRRMTPAGGEHGTITVNLAIIVGQFIKTQRLGAAFGAETGFKIGSNPDTVRAPDFAFVRQERIPPGDFPQGFWPGAPDLAAEVISPSDTYTEVEEKVTDWLNAGSRLVWVINPRVRTVTVYTSLTTVNRLTASEELTGGDVLPGFSCRVIALFS